MSSISNTTNHATKTVKDGASQAREGLLEFGTHVLEVLGMMRGAEGQLADRLLQRMRLQRREGLAQPVACFAAGAVFGASAGLLFAPASGNALRQKIVAFLTGEVDRVTSLVKPVLKSVEKDVSDPEARRTIGSRAHDHRSASR